LTNLRAKSKTLSTIAVRSKRSWKNHLQSKTAKRRVKNQSTKLNRSGKILSDSIRLIPHRSTFSCKLFMWTTQLQTGHTERLKIWSSMPRSLQPTHILNLAISEVIHFLCRIFNINDALRSWQSFVELQCLKRLVHRIADRQWINRCSLKSNQNYQVNIEWVIKANNIHDSIRTSFKYFALGLILWQSSMHYGLRLTGQPTHEIAVNSTPVGSHW